MDDYFYPSQKLVKKTPSFDNNILGRVKQLEEEASDFDIYAGIDDDLDMLPEIEIEDITLDLLQAPEIKLDGALVVSRPSHYCSHERLENFKKVLG